MGRVERAMTERLRLMGEQRARMEHAIEDYTEVAGKHRRWSLTPLPALVRLTLTTAATARLLLDMAIVDMESQREAWRRGL